RRTHGSRKPFQPKGARGPELGADSDDHASQPRRTNHGRPEQDQCLLVHAFESPFDSHRRRRMNNQPIGVFDSGLGGLTVVRALREQLPRESIVYLGDTARVPYGTRSASTVLRYARGCSELLLQRGIKLLVIACNTASAVALDVLARELPIPVIGVVGPGASAAVRAANGLLARGLQEVRIGVLGTLSTIESGAYPRAVRQHSAHMELCTVAAPLLVPLVEEGWLEGDVPELAVARYLTPLLDQ